MNGMNTSHPARSIALMLVLALVLSAAALAGCGGTNEHPGGPSGTGAPTESKVVPDSVRGEVLDTLRAMGVQINDTMVSAVYGASQTHIIVTGPMTASKPLASGTATLKAGTKLSEINVDLVGGKWIVNETK
jgi:hypothetical protein